MSKEDQGAKLSRIVKKAREDEAFKLRLCNNATEVLKEEGLSVPEGMEIKVVENTETVVHIVLPAKHAGTPLDDEALALVAAGYTLPDGSNRVKYSPSYREF